MSRNTEPGKKAQLGQFLTPASTAAFMAGLFPPGNGVCRLLDAGAGVGSLSTALLERCVRGDMPFDRICISAYELDESLHPDLGQTLAAYANKLPVSVEIVAGDFIETAVNTLQFGQTGFTHALLNPPYKKMGGASRSRLLLRQVGIETVNLYSAFVALSLALLAPGGQLVAIIPRSFCNGPYYRPFRDFLLARGAIRHIHLFDSRSQAFRDDGVLQENVILRLERGGVPGVVTVSTSTDDSFADLVSHDYPFERIVLPGDPERFIHVPTSPEHSSVDWSQAMSYSLADLGLHVSTGPVVDFRLKAHLRDSPEVGTVPLLYPGHCSNGGTIWPMLGAKKPNAILRNAETEKWLYPTSFYCVVRRFSSKEERRRVVAGVVDPAAFRDAPMLGFENHLNVFHIGRHGLPEMLARGLAAYLNSSAVDEAFRRFNGHTQVNATDLKSMKYPSRAVLVELGEWAKGHGAATQVMLDQKLKELSL